MGVCRRVGWDLVKSSTHKVSVSSVFCSLASPCSGSDCRWGAIKGGRCRVFPGGGPLTLGDTCEKRLPGHTHIGPDHSEGHAGGTHSVGRPDTQVRHPTEDGSE